MSKFKNLINNTKKNFSNFIEKIFSSKKNTFKFIAIIVFSVLFFLQISDILIRNSFYNNSSDDILQYYTSIVDFVSALKDGSISWFNLNNYFGASFFSDVYYVPLDVFTGITFLLSYIMPIGLAYSVTEFIKIFAGVMLFGYYLSLNNMKNRTIFWMSILYFISGGTVSFMAFPVFLSLTVYMPLALIMIHFVIKKKKRWIVPLFALMSIFYDFYLGYTILAFSCFAFVLEYVKQSNFKFFVFLKELILFVVLLLLGVLMSAVIAYPSIVFILEETYRSTGSFEGWVVAEGLSIFGFEFDLKLFEPEIYIRMFAKMFVEQRPTGFYGFNNSYALEHFSLYISVIGFAYMNYVLFMKDKISRIYKVAIVIALIFMCFPLFSYVFSGTFDAPYTRWINMLPIFQLMILAHVFDKFGFEKIDMKKMTFIIVFFLGALGYLFYYYTIGLSDTGHLASRDMLSADRILFLVSAGYLIVLLVFGWLKKWKVVKVVLWVEIFVAVVYIFMGMFFIPNKIDVFENANQIDEYLDTVLADEGDEFFRVYVDINNLGVEDRNFNRMTGYATNTSIFHSWTDSETNGISYLLYNSKEYQSKHKMNSFAYYLNHFLGYKYVLLDAGLDYDLDNNYFRLHSSNGVYSLYEIIDVSPFKVYETYLTENEFISLRYSLSTISTQKVFLDTVIIDDARYLLSDYNLEEYIEGESSSTTRVSSYKIVYDKEEVNVSGVTDESIRLFYKYDIEYFGLDFEVGSMYIAPSIVNVDDGYNEIFMEYEDGSKSVCSAPSNQSYDIKCDFSEKPKYLYIEDTEELNAGPSLKVRLEAAIDRAAYMVFDLSGLNLNGVESGIIDFELSRSFSFEKGFVVDEFGDKHYTINSFYSYNARPEYLYIFKTGDMYDMDNLYNLYLKVSNESLEDSIDYISNNFVEEESLVIEKGRIDLSYINNSDSTNDQVVVIPVCYSDDWVFDDGNDYETISVNGGFLGIVIPNGTDQINVSMKFVPKGLDTGFLVSVGGILVYFAIFAPGWIKNYKKRKNIIGDDVV